MGALSLVEPDLLEAVDPGTNPVADRVELRGDRGAGDADSLTDPHEVLRRSPSGRSPAKKGWRFTPCVSNRRVA